jgi:hypothetical protein
VGDGGGAAVGGHASSADSGGEDAYLDADLSSKFLRFIQYPAILSKVAATLEGRSPKSREEYWTRIQVQTISPGQRLENGIKTHMGVPSTYKAMGDATKADCFAIIDRSQQGLDNCTSPRMLEDPYVPEEVRQKRYQRLTVHSADHDPYGETDPSERYDLVRRSLRLQEKTSTSTPPYVPKIPVGLDRWSILLKMVCRARVESFGL